jgi:hypothetical protein
MHHNSHIPRRQSLRVARLAVVAVSFALVFCPVQSMAAQTRADRCSILQNQLAEQIKNHAGSSRSAKAATIGAKAKKFCASGKQAQGLRAYAKALQLLGVQPIDPK